jgi:DNA-binding CsgD family transcriptional regulator
VTNKEYLDILNLVYLANRCQDVESLIGTICQSMARATHSECATFHLIKGYPWRMNIVESRSFKSDYHNLIEDKYYPTLYKDGYYQQSPLLKAAISSPKTVLTIGDSISLRDWEMSDFYNYFILPQHLYWELFLPLRWKNNLEGMITLWRSKKQTDYEPSTIAKAEIFAPHMTLAVHNVSMISKINGRTKYLLFTHEANNDGVLLLDHKFRPMYSNTKAREICLYLFNKMPSDTSDIEKVEFPVPSCIIKDCSDLFNFIKAETQFISWPRGRIIFSESGKQFQSECSIIWKADKMNSLPNFMVTLSDLTDKNRLENTLQARFHLSRREVDIVYCVVADMSYREIAEKLYISKLTVHTHIKNIYRKLGVRDKMELYRSIQPFT